MTEVTEVTEMTDALRILVVISVMLHGAIILKDHNLNICSFFIISSNGTKCHFTSQIICNNILNTGLNSRINTLQCSVDSILQPHITSGCWPSMELNLVPSLIL